MYSGTEHLDQRPSMAQMVRFPTVDRIVNLPKEIHIDAISFGDCLLGNENRQDVIDLLNQFRGESYPGIIHRIIELWINGKGEKGRSPVNWDTFAMVLKELGLNELASDIEERIPYEAAQ